MKKFMYEAPSVEVVKMEIEEGLMQTASNPESGTLPD